MNDQLKKFVEDNRDDFDHLEPSAAIFQKIKGELKNKPQTIEKKSNQRFVINYTWLVAASLLIVTCITYLTLSTNKYKTDNQLVKTNKTSTQPEIADITSNELKVPTKQFAANTPTSSKKSTKSNALKDLNFIDMPAVYKDLKDSTSSTTRLAAILKIQNSGIINYDIIDNLSKTLNADGNSNVRLAALNLMSKYAEDSYVANAFLQSLVNQKDPLVQLGLIELLKHTNSPKLDDRLYALANDPTTFEAVKDEAYLVLLNQNKL
jgi:hypothetical protein